jgi:hypothetical protein
MASLLTSNGDNPGGKHVHATLASSQCRMRFCAHSDASLMSDPTGVFDTGLIPEVVSVMRHWVARDLPCMRILFPHTRCGVRPIVSLDVEQDSRTVVYSVSRQDH